MKTLAILALTTFASMSQAQTIVPQGDTVQTYQGAATTTVRPIGQSTIVTSPIGQTLYIPAHVPVQIGHTQPYLPPTLEPSTFRYAGDDD